MKSVLFILLLVYGCVPAEPMKETVKIMLVCDGSESWVYTECLNTACDKSLVKVCQGSASGPR